MTDFEFCADCSFDGHSCVAWGCMRKWLETPAGKAMAEGPGYVARLRAEGRDHTVPDDEERAYIVGYDTAVNDIIEALRDDDGDGYPGSQAALVAAEQIAAVFCKGRG